jgi:hypothetical protein
MLSSKIFDRESSIVNRESADGNRQYGECTVSGLVATGFCYKGLIPILNKYNSPN